MADFRLDRLSMMEAISNPEGLPTQAFQFRIQRAWEKIEQAFDSLGLRIAEIEAVARRDKRSASYTVPTQVLTAEDAGSSAKITVLAHERGYTDGSRVSIASAPIEDLDYETEYGVYYDDEELTGQAITFVATDTIAEAQYGAAEGRHFLGTIDTPKPGDPPNEGGGSYPPGYGGGGNPLP